MRAQTPRLPNSSFLRMQEPRGVEEGRDSQRQPTPSLSSSIRGRRLHDPGHRGAQRARNQPLQAPLARRWRAPHGHQGRHGPLLRQNRPPAPAPPRRQADDPDPLPQRHRWRQLLPEARRRPATVREHDRGLFLPQRGRPQLHHRGQPRHADMAGAARGHRAAPLVVQDRRGAGREPPADGVPRLQGDTR